MNKRLVIYTLGKVAILEAVILIIPTTVGVIYGENVYPFLLTMAITAGCGVVAIAVCQRHRESLYIRDGFAIVSFSWLMVSFFGALPFYLSGEIPNFADAFFESISGFTTTGATVLSDIEALDKGLLFWRCLSQWIGGMGVLVFILAVAEKNPERSINIMKAEMPGSRVDKLKPKAKTTAMDLYNIYIGLTLVLLIILIAGGMPVFDSFCHAFTTAGTGGFSPRNDSLAGFSPFIQYVISVFMLIFGVNYGLYYLIFMKKGRLIFKSEELKLYLTIAAISTLVITVSVRGQFSGWEESFRHSFFQTTAILTTTGYTTSDFDLWPQMAKAVLLMLMFIGGCEGSTSGGLKVSRVLILGKTVKNEIKRSLHPRIVNLVRVNGKPLSQETVSGISAYFVLYIITMVVTFLAISWEPMGFETNFATAVSCVNNIGPGFAGIGPASSFAAYSTISKVFLSFAMLIGRLEIYPIILALYSSTARKY